MELKGAEVCRALGGKVEGNSCILDIKKLQEDNKTITYLLGYLDADAWASAMRSDEIDKELTHKLLDIQDRTYKRYPSLENEVKRQEEKSLVELLDISKNPYKEITEVAKRRNKKVIVTNGDAFTVFAYPNGKVSTIEGDMEDYVMGNAKERILNEKEFNSLWEISKRMESLSKALGRAFALSFVKV